MIGIRTTVLKVAHKSTPDPFDPDPTVTTNVNEVTCLVERLDSSENSGEGSGFASNMAVRVHVKSPLKPNVSVGDEFEWGSNTYRVTTVDDGIMPENRVFHVPFVWRFRGECLSGR